MIKSTLLFSSNATIEYISASVALIVSAALATFVLPLNPDVPLPLIVNRLHQLHFGHQLLSENSLIVTVTFLSKQDFFTDNS